MRLSAIIPLALSVLALAATSASGATTKELLVLRHQGTTEGTPGALTTSGTGIQIWAALGSGAEYCEAFWGGSLASNSNTVDYVTLSDTSFFSHGCAAGNSLSGGLSAVKLESDGGASRAVLEPSSTFAFTQAGPCVYDFATLEAGVEAGKTDFAQYAGDATGALNVSESKASCATTATIPVAFRLEYAGEPNDTGATLYPELVRRGTKRLELSGLGSELPKGTEVYGYVKFTDEELASSVYSDVYLQGAVKSNSKPTDTITLKTTSNDVNSGTGSDFLSYKSGRFKDLELSTLESGGGELTAVGSKLSLELAEHGIECVYEFDDLEVGFPTPGEVVDESGWTVGTLAAKGSNPACARVQGFLATVEINAYFHEQQEDIEAAL
jgi:hypothetical protein